MVYSKRKAWNQGLVLGVYLGGQQGEPERRKTTQVHFTKSVTGGQLEPDLPRAFGAHTEALSESDHWRVKHSLSTLISHFFEVILASVSCLTILSCDMALAPKKPKGR